MVNHRLAMALLLAAFVAVPNTRARAEDHRTASFAWVRLRGAENCASDFEMARAVTSRLGYAPWQHDALAQLGIEATIARTNEGYHVEVQTIDTTNDERGNRDFDFAGADCRSFDAPIALALSLMIDPDVLTRALPAETPSQQVQAPAPVVRNEEPPLPPPLVIVQLTPSPQRTPSPWSFGFGVDGALGPLSRVMIGADVYGGFRPLKWLSIELPIGMLNAAMFRIDPMRAASLTGYWVTPEACVGDIGPNAARFRFCAGPWVAALITSAAGFAKSTSAVAPAAGAELSAHARIRLTDAIALHVGIRTWLAAATVKFDQRDATGTLSTLFTWPTATALLTAGVDFHDVM